MDNWISDQNVLSSILNTFNMEENNQEDMQFKTLNVRELMKQTKNMSVGVFAKRRMGKTVLVKDLLSQIKDWYTNIYVFSQTASLQPWNFDYVPKENIINGMNIDKLNEIWKTQSDYINEEMKNKPKNADPSDYKKTLDHIVLVFDDVIGDPKIRNSPIFNDLFILGRHINVAVFVLSQEFGGKYGLNKVTRSNLDLIICFFPNAEYDRKLMVDQFISTINRKDGMSNLLKLTEEPYHSAVIANFITDHNPENYLFTYKAKLNVPKFTIETKKHKSKTMPTDPFLISRLKRENPAPFEDPMVRFNIKFETDE
jgi:hypothetical protein